MGSLADPSDATVPPGSVPGRHDRARHRHHQGRPHPGDPGAVRRALHEPRPDPGRAALRARPARDDGRPLGRQGGRQQGPRPRRARHRLARHRGRAAADRPARGAPPRASRGPRRAARDGPDRACRSPTSRTTRWRSPSASGRPAVATCSRPTSRTGSTIASGGSSPASSACGSRPRPAARPPWPRMRRAADERRATGRRCLSDRRPRLRPARRPSAPVAGRRAPAGTPERRGRRARHGSTTTWPPRCCRRATARGHKGSFGKLLVRRRLARLRRRGAARLPRGRPGRRRPRDAGRARVAPAAVRGQGRRGDDDGACRRTTSRRSIPSRPWPASSTTSTTPSSSVPGCGPAWPRPSSSASSSRRPGDAAAADRARRRGAPLAGHARRLVGGRPPSGGPDPARRRVRAPAGRQRRRPATPTATWSTTTTPGSPPLATPRRPGARSWCSRVRARSSPHRTARSRSRRSRTRPSPPAGPATCWPGTIGALLAQGLAPFDAARLGVYLHGAAGEAVRERFGDAGLLASDLPDGLAIARKRLAALAERRTDRRLGSGSACARPPARRPRCRTGDGCRRGGSPPDGRGRPGASDAPRSGRRRSP